VIQGASAERRRGFPAPEAKGGDRPPRQLAPTVEKRGVKRPEQTVNLTRLTECGGGDKKKSFLLLLPPEGACQAIFKNIG